jgi:MFS family permease
MSLTIPFYVIVVFSKTILVMTGFDAKLATLLNIILVAVYMITTPISGFLSDKVSEKMILMASVLLTLFFIYPFMAIIQSNELYLIIPAFVVAGILIGFYQGAVPSFSAKCFDVKVRASGVSLAYNLPAIVFGGTAPMIVNAIMNSSGKIIPVAYYVMFGCLCTISALIYSFLKDSK